MPFLVFVFAVLFYRALLGPLRPGATPGPRVALAGQAPASPGPGLCVPVELVFRWGRIAALSHGRRARPSLGFWLRLVSRTTDYAVRLGRAQYNRRAYARMEDQVLVLAPQRTAKSGLLADRILSHPGAVWPPPHAPTCTSSPRPPGPARPPIYVFNPMGVGGLPSHLRLVHP